MALQQFFDSPIYQYVKLHGTEKSAEFLTKETGRKHTVKDIERIVSELRAEHDPYFFDEAFMKIRTKQGKLIPLKNNLGQRKLQEAIDRQQEAGRPVRIKMPKARQFGGSTKTQAKFYRDCHYYEHIQMLTVCHDLDSARNMRAMFDRYNENHPFKSRLQRQNVSPKWWRFPNKDIDYLIDTAEELDTGRSFTPHRLHCSEVAFYRDPETLMLGLLQAVPDDPNTIIILESTANGMGGWWYDLIMGNNDYEMVFVGWQEIEEYKRPIEDKDKAELERSLTEYEKNLIDTFGVSLEQLHWRRYTIDNKLNGDEDKFRQEYPATPEESFIASGRNYFRLGDIKDNLIKAKKHQTNIKRGYLQWDEYGKSVSFTEDRYGWWKIQEQPLYTHENRYVTGSDPAEGRDAIKKEGTKSDPDFSVCTVYDRVDNKVTARFKARVDTDVFEDEICKASVWYKSCLEVVELNNHAGGAIIKGLKDKVFINLYRKETVGKVEDQETVEYGYRTAYGAGGTREMLLSDLRKAIKDGKWKDNDEDFWNEALVFVIGKDGKAQAMQSKHDDTIISSGLCLQGLSQVMELDVVVRAKADEDTPLDADVIWEDLEQTENPIATF